MTQKMKILFLPEGPEIDASSRTRVYNYKSFLENAGFDVTIIPYNCFIDAWLNAMNKKRSLIIKLINKINQLFKCVLYLLIASRYNVIFIHRVLLPKSIFKGMRTLGKKIIFDFDDAIYLAGQKRNSFLRREKFLKRFQYILKLSDYIIVSNEMLKQVASKLNSNIAILTTPVDTQKLTPKSERYDDGKVVIGWIGSPGATRFIEPLKKTFDMLVERYPFLKMKLVGAAPIQGWRIDMTVKEWSLEDEVKDLQSLDIGIMPLEDDEWCRAKGGYKLFQYMAVGIPCVASPVGINKEIVRDGINGFLAQTPDEWLDKLSLLIENALLRKRLGQGGRRLAEKLYSYRVSAPRLIEILKDFKESNFRYHIK